MGTILAILQAIPALGRIFAIIERLFHAWKMAQLEKQVDKDKADIDAAFKLDEAKKAMEVADARERARKLREIFKN